MGTKSFLGVTVDASQGSNYSGNPPALTFSGVNLGTPSASRVIVVALTIDNSSLGFGANPGVTIGGVAASLIVAVPCSTQLVMFLLSTQPRFRLDQPARL